MHVLEKPPQDGTSPGLAGDRINVRHAETYTNKGKTVTVTNVRPLEKNKVPYLHHKYKKSTKR